MSYFTSDSFKVWLISTGKTFVTTYVVTIATIIVQTGTVQWTFPFWAGIAISAFRTVFGRFVDTFVPVKLGGRKI